MHRRLSATHQFSKFGEERGEWAGSKRPWVVNFPTVRVDSTALNETDTGEDVNPDEGR